MLCSLKFLFTRDLLAFVERGRSKKREVAKGERERESESERAVVNHRLGGVGGGEMHMILQTQRPKEGSECECRSSSMASSSYSSEEPWRANDSFGHRVRVERGAPVRLLVAAVAIVVISVFIPPVVSTSLAQDEVETPAASMDMSGTISDMNTTMVLPSADDVVAANEGGGGGGGAASTRLDSTVFPWLFGNFGESGSITMKLIDLGEKHPEARCLDGTPAFMFFSESNLAARNKWMVYHTVGGWCTSITDCCKRAGDPMLGSSARLGQYKSLFASGQDARMFFSFTGYLARDKQQNPNLHDYNIIFMPYCDGGSWSGNRDEPLENVCQPGEPNQLYFRGSKIIDAAIDEMRALGAEDATDVLVAGGSAGGLSVFYHADRFAESFPNANVTALSDSSMFLDFDTDAQSLYSAMHVGQMDALGQVRLEETSVPGRTAQQLQWLYYMMNATAGLDQSCVEHYSAKGMPWKCMFPQYTAKFVETPTFILQSIFDWWQVAYSLAVSDFTGHITNAFGELIRNTTLSVLEGTRHGAFIDSCVHHTSINMWSTSVTVEGFTQAEAYGAYLRGERRLWSSKLSNYFDPCSFCCNEFCMKQCSVSADGTYYKQQGSDYTIVEKLPYFPFYKLGHGTPMWRTATVIAVSIVAAVAVVAMLIAVVAWRRRKMSGTYAKLGEQRTKEGNGKADLQLMEMRAPPELV